MIGCRVIPTRQPSTGVFPCKRKLSRSGHDMRPLNGPSRKPFSRWTPPPQCRSTAPAARCRCKAPPARATGRRHCRRRLRRRRMNPPSPRRSPAPQAWPVPISEAARLAGVSAAWCGITNRWACCKAWPVSEGGYRQYTEADVHSLHFIAAHATWASPSKKSPPCWPCGTTAAAPAPRSSASRKATSTSSPQRIAAMQAMQRTLQTLVGCCQGTTGRTAPSWTTWLGRAPEVNQRY